MTIWIFLTILAGGFALMQFGWLVAMVGIYALLTKSLAVIAAVLVLGIVGYGVSRLYRNRRLARTPRLIFKRD